MNHSIFISGLAVSIIYLLIRFLEMKMITKEWNQKNVIFLKFKKIIHHDIMKILNKYDLLKYYDSFVDLGAKTKEDFEYIEMTDLVEMNFTKEEIKSFQKINPMI